MAGEGGSETAAADDQLAREGGAGDGGNSLGDKHNGPTAEAQVKARPAGDCAVDDDDLDCAEIAEPDTQEEGRSRLTIVCVVIVGVACAGFAMWATLTGRLQDWMVELGKIPYALTFAIIVALMIFMNMPFGYGYSVSVFCASFGFGWSAAPPVLLGGLILGPWLARYVNTRLMGQSLAFELVRKIPNATAQRWVRAVILGIQRDRFSVLIVCATRCSPLAVGLQHLVLCAAGPPFWAYALGMVVGGMPDLFGVIYMGTLVRAAADSAMSDEADEKVENIEFMVLVGQCIACMTLMCLVSFAARRMLRKYSVQEPNDIPTSA